MPDKPMNAGLQLFPPPPRKMRTPSRERRPSRTPSTRRAEAAPQSPESAVEQVSPVSPETGRHSALDGRISALDGRFDGQSTPLNRRETPQNGHQNNRPVHNGRQASQPEQESPPRGRNTPQNGRETPQNGHQNNRPVHNGRQASQPEQESPPRGRNTPQIGRYTPQPGEVSSITPPPQAHIGESIPRSHTSLSEAPTLVRRNSNSSHTSHTSLAKHAPGTSPPREEPVLRSIFPRYNPEIALEHQAYYPTQSSPTHIPPAVINRQPYSPSISGRSAAGLQSPMSIGSSPGRFPRGVLDESILEPSHNEELKEMWKVVNGWRVSASEGRKFCLKMSSAAEEPVHTLSSSTQPFYTLRLVPTSTSAQMTMLRHDPNKPMGSPKLGSSSKNEKGIEVMSTTLEETARRLPPNDGLVALLYPKAASDMVIDLANKIPARADADQVIAAAERECGRVVWDEDSGKYYLVHPAISTPFVVSISSSPAWSRVEYTLEHSELPRNIVRLVRDGAGSGFLEVDTGVAAKIDCFYVVDVAICAIMLVAIAEEKNHNVERFDAPPSIAPMSPPSRRNSGMSVWGKAKGKKSKKDKEKDVKIEEFEMDLESQDSMRDGKGKGKEKKEKVPGFFGLIWMLIKCFAWLFVGFFKLLAKFVILISKCLTRRKK